MKSTQALHSWRRVTAEWDGAVQFKSLATLASLGFEASEVSVRGGLLLLAGVNSGGKSRLLKSIWKESHDPSGAGSALQWEGEAPAAVVYVDLFDLLTRQWAAQQAPDLLEQVEAAGLTAMKASHVRNISYVVGREYESIRIAELEAPGAVENGDISDPSRFRDEVVPYFEVSTSGRVHASRDLSRGELSALTLHWVLESAPRGSLLLLDEPDLMLSPLSAQRALDLVVDHANSTKVPVVLATHSYLGLANAPRSSQVLLRIGASGASSLATPDDYALWDALRVAAPKQIAFVVEDEMARLLLKELLGAVGFPHLDVSDIWIGGSAAEVRSVGKLPTLRYSTVSIWGVLDGNEELRKGENRCMRLPGKQSPEQGALTISASHPHLLTPQEKTLQRALERTVGDDPHDRVHAVADALGMTAVSFVLKAWTQWTALIEDGQEELEAFKRSLEKVLPSHALESQS